MTKILIIDGEKCVRNSLKESLEHEGYDVDTSEDCLSALPLVESLAVRVIICDATAFEVLLESKVVQGYRLPVIVLGADVELAKVVQTMRQGAFDYMLRRPLNMNLLRESLAEAIKILDVKYIPAIETIDFQTTRQRSSVNVDPIVGDSPQIQHVKKLIDKVAPSDARVLITGANGTGKELVARWLHEKSKRFEGPFVEVNCAAIPSELIESELFGHEKGAFTSAIKQRKGKFEQAHGGTLFLDEIGDMSLSAQAKVLRALQERKISRVGSDKDVDVNVRVVAATNKNLQDEIHKGNFREDLYHRLSVIIIAVPPLAQRREDVPLLVNYFLEKLSAEYSIAQKQIEPAAIRVLSKMSWTGNIRELRNVIERLIILSSASITEDDVKLYAFEDI